MIAVRLIYLALLITSGIFVILYVDSLALLLFMVVLMLPILLFLMLLLARILTRISIEPIDSVVTAGSPVDVKIRIKNRSFITLTGARARITFENLYAGGETKTELMLPIRAFSNQAAVCEVNSPHAGIVKINIRDVVLQDYFRLFTLKIRLKKSMEICFLPEIHPINMEIRQNTWLNDESDTFSKHKKGDDPSEVFAIRDYVPGDKLNRIHWKLSSKSDNLMVKDYSLPINNNLLIMPELMVPGGEDCLKSLDAVLSTAASMSSYLIEAEIIHFLAWFDKLTGEFVKFEIKELTDLYTAFGMLLKSRSEEKAASLVCFSADQARYSHVAYISAVIDNEVMAYFEDFSFTSFCTVFPVLSGIDGEFTPDETNTVNVHPVKQGKVAASIGEIVL